MQTAAQPFESTATGASAPAARAGYGGVGNRTVLVYLAIALLAVVPGLAAKLLVTSDGWSGTVIGPWLEAMRDIRFGSGIRFWLGVAGASAMGVLLLYPLRKWLSRRSVLGRVGLWFNFHMLVGVFAPVLILYHCNFGLGALNANVALWTMLAVMASGIVGHFIYARVSAVYYAGRGTAREQLDAFAAALGMVEGQQIPRRNLVERLQRYEATTLAPRGGIAASVKSRFQAAYHRRQLHRDLSLILTAVSHDPGSRKDDIVRRGQELHGRLRAYLDTIAATAGSSVLEQIWARWRLFHLPVFLVMTVATGLHVAAVWNLDDGPTDSGPATSQPMPAPEAAPPISMPDVPLPAKTPSRDQIASLIAGASSSAGTSRAIEEPGQSAAAVTERAPAAAPPLPPPRPPQATAVSPPGPAPAPTARLVVMPHEITAPTVASPPPSPKIVPHPMRQVVVAAEPPKPAPPRMVPESRPEPVRKASETPAPTPAPSMTATYAELKQRTEQPPPMGLGASKPVLTLAQRISELKSQNFDHAKTKFPLIGKHQRADCADCHTKALEGTLRECIACHKRDDVHNGRRLDCARCHTPTRWTQIIRR